MKEQKPRGAATYRHFRWSTQRAADQQVRVALVIPGGDLLLFIIVGKIAFYPIGGEKTLLQNFAGLDRLVLHQKLYQKGNMTEIEAKQWYSKSRQTEWKQTVGRETSRVGCCGGRMRGRDDQDALYPQIITSKNKYIKKKWTFSKS